MKEQTNVLKGSASILERIHVELNINGFIVAACESCAANNKQRWPFSVIYFLIVLISQFAFQLYCNDIKIVEAPIHFNYLISVPNCSANGAQIIFDKKLVYYSGCS